MDSVEIGYLRRFANVRNYLVHASHPQCTFLRLGGSTFPLQESNLGEDLLDAFRITLSLEPRLASTIRHIEASLHECVTQADLTVSTTQHGDERFFCAHLFRNDQCLYRVVVSRTEHPMPRISCLAQRWKAFSNFTDLHWPLSGEYNSEEDALNAFSEYVETKWKRGGSVSELQRRAVTWSPPSLDSNDWPWRRLGPRDSDIDRQLDKLLNE